MVGGAVSGHLVDTKMKTLGFNIKLTGGGGPPIPHPETSFSLFMHTDVNYKPFAPARSLSLQFMIQAVTTSFDPILVMLISSYNGGKSV